MTFLRPKIQQFFDRESIRPDLGRGLRATIAVTVPLLLAAAGWWPAGLSVAFVAIAAQSIAIVDVRGAYSLRLILLLAMAAIFAGATALGGAAAASLWPAVLLAGLVAALGGLWRHVTPDYGASIAVSSLLLYVIAVNSPASAGLAAHDGLSALVGGVGGVLLQVALWPIRPQHPLRAAVADSWVAVAGLFESLAVDDPAKRAARIQQAEADTRAALDRAYEVLASNRATKKTRLRPRLEQLNLAAARIATRVVALNTALEELLAQPDAGWLVESLQPLLRALTNLSRSVAIAVVSRQPTHFALSEVRLRRLSNLLRVFQTNARAHVSDAATAAQLRDILRQIERHLPEVHEALRATVDRAGERAAFSLELLDLQTWTLRPIAAALILHRRVDAALARFTVRIAVLTMVGVAIAKYFGLEHGYWLPLTTVIVLQPDYGSTRQRAAQRMLGTLVGSIAASLLLWLHLPFAAIAAATALTVFCFCFLLKRHYAVAVVFITLFVVLMTEANSPVTVWFTVERLAVTVGGGALALLAALYFWPVWERDRFPPILAAALEANRIYLDLIATRYREGGLYDAAVVTTKRKTETAISTAFASLQRMMGDPRNQREGLERAAALANGNQRVTRALNVLALHLKPGVALRRAEFDRFAALAGDILTALAKAERQPAPPASLAPLSAALDRIEFPARAASGPSDAPPLEHWVFGQFAHIATELGAMLLALEPPASDM